MKGFGTRALVFSTFLLTLGGVARAGDRGGGSSGYAHKMSGPGPFWAIGGKLGAALSCGDCSGSLLPPPAWWQPRWLDVSLVFLIGESDFEGTNVHSVTVEPSLEWAFMVRGQEEVDWYERFFVGAGFAMTNFRGEEFEDFWRSSVVLRGGFRLPVAGDRLRVGGGVSYFPTAFNHGEFAGDPVANERWVPFAFVEVFFWE